MVLNGDWASSKGLISTVTVCPVTVYVRSMLLSFGTKIK